MRMRKKPNLIPRMERCAGVQIKNPEEYKGRWAQSFSQYNKIYLELGCGKGRFTAGTAETMPDTLIIAVERVPDAMVVGMERVCAAGLENVRFIDYDASKLLEIFQPEEIDRIYINFCDPWIPNRQAKRRLTHHNFLRLYRQILKPGSEIHFKTDNQMLFEFSLAEFANTGFELHEVTRDLHENGPVGIMTDYEAKFYDQGMKINRCVAKMVPWQEPEAEKPIAAEENGAV